MDLIFRPGDRANAASGGGAAAPGASADDGARIPGVPHALPPGERVLWHGRPDAAGVRRHVFKVPVLAAYLGVMVLVWAVASRGDAEFAKKAVLVLGACALALGYVWWVAALTAQHTVYAITDRRVVMQVGLAFTSMVNIPLRLVQSLALADHGDGTGSLALTMPKEERLAYALLWPHARPWRFTHPEPMLRAIREPARVGAILATALTATLAPAAADAAPGAESASSGRAGPRPAGGDRPVGDVARPAFAAAAAAHPAHG